MASGFVSPLKESGADAGKTELVVDANRSGAGTVAAPLLPTVSVPPLQVEGKTSPDDSGVADIDIQDQLLEEHSAPSRSSSGSSEVSESELTRENVRALKRGKRDSDAKVKELEERIKEIEEKSNAIKLVDHADSPDYCKFNTAS